MRENSVDVEGGTYSSVATGKNSSLYALIHILEFNAKAYTTVYIIKKCLRAIQTTFRRANAVIMTSPPCALCSKTSGALKLER